MKTKRFAAVVASLGIIASMAAIVPMSAGAAYPVADQATGGSVKFNKYLVIPTWYCCSEREHCFHHHTC